MSRIRLAACLLTIYATLGVVRDVTNALRERGLLRLSVVAAFALAGGAMLWLIFRDPRNRNAKVLTVIAIALAVYAMVILPMESLEEKIHFIEYGIVALLADAAAPKRVNRYAFAALFTIAAGWIDELIQWLLPSRYYDPRDVAFNAAAGLIALGALAAVRRGTRAPAD